MTEKDGDTVFHKIIRRELDADVLFEDELCIAFRDIEPVAPFHVLVVPKKNLKNLSEAGEGDEALLGHMLLVAKDLAKRSGLSEGGYRVVLNTGDLGGQTVYQLHFHLHGGRGFSWPPG